MPDDVIPNTLIFGVSSEINHKKLQNIEHLVQKLTRLNSTHDKAHTDYIASLCENTKPDDRYISEILLALGILLRDLGSSLTTFQFHSSGHPINPELFLLIFDTVNEVLAKKLALVVPSLESFSSKSFKLANNTLNGQKLLRDLYEEDDGLKTILWEEVLNHAESWTDYDGELPVNALEVERLIFKDLVNEVVLGEASHEELLQVKKKKEDVSLDEEDDGLKTILWEEVLNHAESWTDYDGELPVNALEVERLIFKDLVNEVVLGEASHGVLLWKGELLFVGRNSLLATVLFYRVWLSVQIAGDISGSTDIVKNQIAYCLIFSLIISLISNALSASPDTISILSHDASFSCYFQETVMVIGNDQLIKDLSFCQAMMFYGHLENLLERITLVVFLKTLSTQETVIRSHGLLEDLSVDALLSQASEYFSKFTGLSARCQGVRFKYDMLMELTRREKIAGIRHEEDLDIFMKALVLGEHETALVVEYILKVFAMVLLYDL
ncbi:longifolia 1-like protein [Tanacetum coccineum]